MGTGASKSQGRQGGGGSDEDDDDLPIADNNRRREQAEQKKVKIRSKPNLRQPGFMSSNKQEKPPKVIGLVDSDEEDAEKQEQEANNNKLNDDLDELDRTFNSLGMVGKAMWKDGEYTGSTTRQLASEDRWNKNTSAGRGGERATATEEDEDDEEDDDVSFFMQTARFTTGHTRFPPGAGSRRTSLATHGKQIPGQGRGAPIKFSWNQETTSKIPLDKHTEDWTYKKTVIDGFDPDKFRQVNKQPHFMSQSMSSRTATAGGVGGASLHRYTAGTVRGPSAAASVQGSVASGLNRNVGDVAPPSSRTTSFMASEMDVPGTVPTYDRTEQQLLASLEQELGVL